MYGTAEQVTEAQSLINRVLSGEKLLSAKVVAREQQRQRLRDAMAPDAQCLNVALDLTMAAVQSDKELHKLANQTRRMYGINLDCETPAHLHLTGMEKGGRLEKVLTRYCEGFENYVISKAAAPHGTHFAKERLVYLTPDSPNPLLELHPDKVYVIGGLVDEHILKNFTLDKAETVGIATARLPITEMAHKISDKPKSANQVLAPNQVFQILLRFWSSRDWVSALEGNLPVRKGYAASSKDESKDDKAMTESTAGE